MNDQSVKLKRKNLIRMKKLKGSLRKLFLALTVLLLFFKERNHYLGYPISGSTVIGRELSPGSGINRLIVIASTISVDVEVSSFSFPSFGEPISGNRRGAAPGRGN